MMNQNDAHSGANPETEDDGLTDEIVDEEFDEDEDDDRPAFEVVYDSALDKRAPRTAREPSEPVPSDPVAPPDLAVPVGTLSLLDAQLGEVLKIMQDFTTWIIHQPNTDIHICMSVADTVGRLAQSSAVLGKVATRLQNGDPESRHRVIVEYAAPDGGGVVQSRKRMNRGGA